MRKPAFSSSLAILTAALAVPRGAAADVRVFDRAASETLPALSLDLFGWAQPRFAWQQHDTRPSVHFEPNPAFTVQSARLGAVAGLGDHAEVHLEVDLAREIAQPIDAYVVVTPFRRPEATLQVSLGQLRVPFSRQNLLAAKSRQFADNAYFVAPKFVVDRDLGVQLGVDLFEGRGRLLAGVFNGNEPGRGQTLNADAWFLFAGRVEVSPLGRPPRFEGDLRPVADRAKPIVTLGLGAMRNRLEDKSFYRTYFGADLGFWWQGLSLYAEAYHRTDCPIGQSCPVFFGAPQGSLNPAGITGEGWNVQAGYFPPLPWLREHLEVAARVQRFDPAREVASPANDAGARDLDQSNPTWGYLGVQVGGSFYWDRGHDLKLSGSYEIRNETKSCLQGQSGNACTGVIANNLLLIQGTAAF